LSKWPRPVSHFGCSLVLLFLQLEIQSAEIPEIQTSHMEIAVVQLIETTRAKLEKNLNSAEAWGRLGMVFHAHGLLQPAIACYQQAARRDSTDYRWPYLAATALRNSNRTDAIAYYAEAWKLKSNDYVLAVTYADTLTRNGQYEDALALYKAALPINEAQSFALIGLARIAFIDNDLVEAQTHLQNARQIDPNDREIYTLLAQVHMSQGNEEAAKEAEWLARTYPHAKVLDAPIIEAMRSFAETAGAFVARGKRKTELGDYRGAESAFRQVLARRPGLAFDYGNLANVLARRGQHAEALEYFERGLKINPNNVEMLSNQSLALMADGQLDRAGKKLIKAIELDPNYGHAHFNLGVLRYRQRDYGEAVEHFGDALSTNPALTQAYLNLGTTYAAMGKFPAAIDVWKQLERIQPNNSSLIFNIGLGWLRLGQDAKASSALRKAFGLEPNNKQIATTLIKLLATSERHSVRDVLQAITLAERWYASRPRDPVVADLLAIAFAANGNFDRAVRYSEIALEFGKADRKFANEVRSRLERYRKKVTF